MSKFIRTLIDSFILLEVDLDQFPPNIIVDDIAKGVEKNMDTFICYSCLDGNLD